MTRSAGMLPLLLCLICACNPGSGGPSKDRDADGDGYEAGDDCDDDDAGAHPGAQEACNDGADNDCDTLTDQDDTQDCAPLEGATGPAGDGDGDGRLGDEDCDDDDDTVYLGAYELCDGRDSDCDGTDEDADAEQTPGCTTWYADLDGDGVGAGDARCMCQSTAEQGGGWSELGDDCDDADPSVGPEQTEVCANDLDDDCDGETDELDEPDALGCTVFYADADEDGHGSAADAGSCLCGDAGDHPAMSTDDTDCDDDNTESQCTDFAMDGDGDGYGDLALTHCQCAADGLFTIEVTGRSETDCDDADPDTHPDALEICEGGDTQVDNDCDGDTDPDDGTPTDNDCDEYYLDRDDDGFGTDYAPISPTCRCTDPSTELRSWSLSSGDCDDHDGEVNPSNAEVCNGLDDDCDDEVDDGVTVAFYADTDGDLYGDPSTKTDGCTGDAMDGWVEGNKSDCDDTDIDAHPGATEDCSTSVDEDCDGDVNDTDEPVANGEFFYLDSDGDDYGRSDKYVYTCVSPSSSYVSSYGDCNDSSSSIHPGATETCDGVDQDCDLVADDGVTVTLYPDNDHDGYGDPSGATIPGCVGLVAGYSEDDTDCDDDDPDVTGLDRATRCRDLDGDGYWGCSGVAVTDTLDDYLVLCPTSTHAGSTTSYRCREDLCPSDAAYTVAETDYGDCSPSGGGAETVNPSADEDCDDGVDNDCDGRIDTSDHDAAEVCDGVDNDCDGETDEGFSEVAEVCDDGVDNDCDGKTDEKDPTIEEVCDGIDNDCDGEVDNVSATVETVCDDGIDDDCDGYTDTDDDDCATTAPAAPPRADDTCDTGVWP